MYVSKEFGGSSKYELFHSASIEDVREYMSAHLAPHDLYTEGPDTLIDFHLTEISLGRVTVGILDYGCTKGAVHATVPSLPDSHLACLLLDGEARISSKDGPDGRDLTAKADDLLVIGAGTSFKVELRDGFRSILVKIADDLFTDVVANAIGGVPGESVEFDLFAENAGCRNSMFASLVRVICDELGDEKSVLHGAFVRSYMDRTIAAALLAGVPNNYSDAVKRCSFGPVPYYVRRAEEYIRRNAKEALTLAEIVESSGVCARTLHSGFQRFRSTTPIKYLGEYRLDLARRELPLAADRGLTVADVATECGITHLSRFAKNYARRFGHKPSEALRGLIH